jgi:hypothetical protein
MAKASPEKSCRTQQEDRLSCCVVNAIDETARAFCRRYGFIDFRITRIGSSRP